MARAIRALIAVAKQKGLQEQVARAEARLSEMERAASFDIRLRNRVEPVPGPIEDEIRTRFASPLLALQQLGAPLVENSSLADINPANTELLRLSFSTDLGTMKRFAVRSNDYFALLDGTGSPLHSLNRMIGLNLKEDQVLAYLWVFCEVLVDNDGDKFLLCETPEDFDWRADAKDAIKREAETHLRKVEILSSENQGSSRVWTISATLIWADRLRRATFKVMNDGTVELPEEESLMINLPVASFMRAPAKAAPSQAEPAKSAAPTVRAPASAFVQLGDRSTWMAVLGSRICRQNRIHQCGEMRAESGLNLSDFTINMFYSLQNAGREHECLAIRTANRGTVYSADGYRQGCL